MPTKNMFLFVERKNGAPMYLGLYHSCVECTDDADAIRTKFSHIMGESIVGHRAYLAEWNEEKLQFEKICDVVFTD